MSIYSHTINQQERRLKDVLKTSITNKTKQNTTNLKTMQQKDNRGNIAKK